MSVWFDFWLPDGSLGGFCGLGDDVGFLAGLVGEGRSYVLVSDPEAQPRGLEVRAEGLWAAFNKEDAEGSHWSWGLEAFAVAFDDPEVALRSAWGDRVALGFDLEWEAPSLVHGEVLVGGPPEHIAFEGFGRLVALSVAEPGISRPNGSGVAAPVRLAGGRALRQWLVGGEEGWVREWAPDAAGAGTA